MNLNANIQENAAKLQKLSLTGIFALARQAAFQYRRKLFKLIQKIKPWLLMPKLLMMKLCFWLLNLARHWQYFYMMIKAIKFILNMPEINLENKIKNVLNEIKPALQRHGGDCCLESIKDGAVFIKVQGACRGCPMSVITFQLGVDKILKEKVPEVKEIKYV